MDKGFKVKDENPKEEANLVSQLFFGWMIKTCQKASEKGLNIGDLYRILQSDSSELLGDRLESNWNNELIAKSAKSKKPKLLNAILNTFIWNYMFWGVVLFVQHVGLRTFQPIVLSYFIALFAEKQPNNTAMYLSAGILVTISILVVFAMHHSNFGQAAIGMRVRIAISSLIYRKTLKLNKKSLNQTAVGQVVNLLSNDVSRFDLVILSLHYFWILPFQVSLITYLLWLQVGVSSFTGVLCIALLSLPVQGYLGKVTSNLRGKVAQRTDYRVTLMSEIITGVQVIKMYAWEKPFEKLVKMARLHEVKALTSTSYLRGVYLSFMLFVERTALFLTLICHVLLGREILPEYVFSMAQFFNLLQLTMSIYYPMAINYGAEALVAIDRIESFLLMDETEESVVETDFENGVRLENVQASWLTFNQPVLKNISVNIPPGSLCAIIGPVGSGKSSFLQLLLSELKPNTGSIKLQGSIAYSAQEPWLFASTVRNNILFGQNYNKDVYNKVAKVCCLVKDFEQFPQSDKTLVGERGTSLSGGQRARINLARSVYRDAEIYLLDDPLSAVDTHVGRHLFDECIVKYLGNKTRILVTHQLQYLKKADMIIVMNDGKIEAVGNYKELSKKKLKFTEGMLEEGREKDPRNPQQLQQHNSHLSSSFMIESFDIRSTMNVVEEETGMSGSTSPLRDYIKYSGNCCQISAVVFVILLCQILCSVGDYWVTFWTQQEELRYKLQENYTSLLTNQSLGKQVIDEPPEPGLLVDRYTAVYIYTGLVASAILVTLIRSTLYFTLAMNASKNMHNEMFSALLDAPMRFFNLNPSGRILNRFAKDMGAIDEILPKVLLEAIQITLVMFGIIIMVVISNVYMIIAVVILGYVFLKIRKWFIATATDIKHLEGITKSPVFSHLSASLQGMTTIRAYNAENMLKNEFDVLQDVHTSAWFLTIGCMVCFGLWLDLICVTFIATTSFGFIILHQFGQVSGSLVGLAISQSLVLTGMLQYGIRQTAEVVNQLTSVERVLQYTDLEKEGPFETFHHNVPSDPWPSLGLIEIKHLYLQYSPNENPVLQNINVTIKPAQKIGIVGRTGAGKSSLISAIFRLTDIEGTILIDEVDTQSLGLWDLRKNISIIPQEPVLFSASLRYNLDPFDEFTDDTLWKVLQEVELKDYVDSLDMRVAGGGGNFSVGQRQLLCLARAILRDNKILVLDEATANIDPKTDGLIQKTIRQKFKYCTVLTIAHRLNTIMDSDKVIVMDDGEIIEFGHPYRLLQKPDTIFHKMVLETGQSMSSHLEDIALDAFLNRKLQY